MEAEAESTALLVGNDKLENKFAQLESGTGAWAVWTVRTPSYRQVKPVSAGYISSSATHMVPSWAH